MYNGIGLQTARGSGTSGYVQKNQSYVKPEFFRKKVNTNRGSRDQDGGAGDLKRTAVNADIIEHNRKRAIEAKLFEFQDDLESRGMGEDEVMQRVAEMRERLEASQEAYLQNDDRGGGGDRGTSSTSGSDYRSNSNNSRNTSNDRRGRDRDRERGNNSSRYGLQHQQQPHTRGSGGMTDSHETAAAKAKENERAKSAFGIRGDWTSGSSFDADAVKARKEAEIAEREERRAQRALEAKERAERRARAEEELRVHRAERAAREQEREKGRREADDGGRRDRCDRDRDRDRRYRDRSRDRGRYRGSDRDRSRSRSRSGDRARDRGRHCARVDRSDRYQYAPANNDKEEGEEAAPEGAAVGAAAAPTDALADRRGTEAVGKDRGRSSSCDSSRGGESDWSGSRSRSRSYSGSRSRSRSRSSSYSSSSRSRSRSRSSDSSGSRSRSGSR